MVDSVDAMKKERDEAVKKLAAAVQEANVFKECLEGRCGVTGGGKASKKGAAAAASKTCPPCNKLYTAKIEAIKKNHADEINKLQLAVKQWTVKYDARLEAHVFSHRFRDRENELRQRVEVLELELCKVGNELREKKANFDTHMVSTLKHKAIAKELAAMKENFELAKSRVVELEKSVMQVVFFIITFSNQPLTLSSGLRRRRPLQEAPRPNAPCQACPRDFTRKGRPACSRTRHRAAPCACEHHVRGRPSLRLPLASCRVQPRRWQGARDQTASAERWRDLVGWGV